MTPIKICKPTLKATKANISQHFSKEHRATDWALGYGEFILAPCDCRVVRIKTENIVDGDLDSMEQGCGLLVESVGDPKWHFAPWHTLPAFPVKAGDIVSKGTPIAQVGNYGYVQGWNGKEIITYTPQEREKELSGNQRSGTHIHYSASYDDVPVDMETLIDWDFQPKFNVYETVLNFLKNIKNLLTAR